MVILIIALIVVIAIIVWFMISYSPLKSEFKKRYDLLSRSVFLENKTFSAELLSTKPELLQKYIRYCGLNGKPMMKSTFTVHNNADFLLKDNSPMCKIQYKQANFSTLCERLAFIDTKMLGVLPFQGLDDNMGGKGRMKGVIAKLFTAFDVQGKEMDIAALVTVLAESIVCPSFLILNEINWEVLDSRHLKATLLQYEMTVSGVFEFDEDGAILGFYTKDRYEENNGNMTQRDWRIECGSYKEINGIKHPSIFKAIWVYPDFEKVYFDCNNVVVNYKY